MKNPWKNYEVLLNVTGVELFLLVKLAWRNLIRHLRKSILLGSLIAIGICILFISNSIFLGTNQGMKKTFIGSFTGDIVIGSGSGGANSLFGNEIPIVSDFDAIDPILEYSDVKEILMSIEEIDTYTSIVSVSSGMSIDGIDKVVALFGVDPVTYFDVCHDISIIKGDINRLSDKGVFINSFMADELEAALHRTLQIGEQITFTLYSNNSFRIRSAPLLGIVKYSGSTEALNRVVLGDLTTVRSIANYTLGLSSLDFIEENSYFDNDISFEINDLFSTSEDISMIGEDSFNLHEFEETLSYTEDRDSLVTTDNGAWSFILIKAVKGKTRNMISNLRKNIKRSGFSLDLLSWRRAAGTTALVIFAIQSIFYLGIGFLGVGAVLVIMNALVISVLERSNEIGTMRSIGASPTFIRHLFMMESLLITVLGALGGIILGLLIVWLSSLFEIHLSNSLLISLFGGTTISPIISILSIFLHLLVALIIGSLSWIYPVTLAMRIQPVTAMNKG